MAHPSQAMQSMCFLSMACAVMDIATKNRQIIHHHLCLNKDLHATCFRGKELEITLISKYHENRRNFEVMVYFSTESKQKHFCMSKIWNKLTTSRQE